MVSGWSIFAIILNLFICFGIPIGGLIYLRVKRKKPLKPFITGMAVFIIFQVLIRIPILQNVLPNVGWFNDLRFNPWGYGLFLGVTAGIAEEFGRYIAFSSILKKRLSFYDGIAYGLGHGGIEAMLLAGIVNINNMAIALDINRGTFDTIAAASGGVLTEAVKEQFINSNFGMFFIGGLERIFAMTIQIALTFVVLYAVRKKKFRYVIIAILIHTVIDAPLVILPQVFGISNIGVEIWAGIAALILAVWIFKAKKIFINEENYVK